MARRRRLSGRDGAQREFAREADRILREKVAPVGPANAVRVSFPRNHPLAKELLELASLLSNRQERPASGLKVLRKSIPGADERILGVLARMGVDVERIKKDLAAGEVASRSRGSDPILEVGLGLLRVASEIAGAKGISKTEDDLRRLAERAPGS